MGCDIHIWAERKTSYGHKAVTDTKFTDGPAPFDWRSYGMFGFLAGVRNYSDVPPISEPRGFPDDMSPEAVDELDAWDTDAHTPSWLTVEELAAFDYDQPVEDRRITVQVAPNAWNGAGTAEPGGGKMTTWREFLGKAFMDDLEKLKASGADRIVFWFDN